MARLLASWYGDSGWRLELLLFSSRLPRDLTAASARFFILSLQTVVAIVIVSLRNIAHAAPGLSVGGAAPLLGRGG